MGEGVVSVTASAVGTANMVLADRGMKIYTQRKFPTNHVHHVKGKKRDPLPPKGLNLTTKQAQRLALECQWCEDPTCISNCPAHVDVPGFIRRIEAGNFAGAARLIREQNPLAELCGKACPAENLCMSTCTRKEYANSPVRINDLQAWTCQQAGQEGWPKESARSLGKSVAVVGAGPAGLSCSYYLARLGYDVHLFDPNPGGVPAAAVPGFRVPAEVVEKEVSTILGQNNITLNKKGLGTELTLDMLEKEYNAVFLACGTGEGKIINIDGLDKNMAIDALSYLKACRNKSMQPLKGKVVVIGGGSVASDAALMAKYQGADVVTLVCMETLETMPCLISERAELKTEGIIIQSGWAPSHVEGQELVLSGCDSVFNEAGEFAPVLDISRSQTVHFDHIVMAVGQQIERNLRENLLKEFPGLEIDVNENTQKVMGRKKLFAGGDLVKGSKTIIDAVAEGRRAAVAINLQISEEE
jgi:NADPH-dependent glutamate synthase beta subunit-like oxidoreductase